MVSENDFEAVLDTSCCYDHDGKASEVVHKIATYQKSSQMLLACYNLLNSQNTPINQQQWKMVGYKDTSGVANKAAEVAQKK